MHKIILSIALTAAAISAAAQSVGQMLTTMPDSIFPYLTAAQRSELLNIKRVDAATPAVLRSKFGNDIKLLRCDDDRMTLRTDSAATMEMARLATNSGDSLYCLLRTLGVPEKETAGYIYNKEWRKVADVDMESVSLLQRPDTMTAETYAALLQLIEFPIVEARFLDNKTLVLRQHVPMISKEERKQLEAILVEKRMRWNGERFIEE